jgi:hypothetical protein
VQYLIPYKLADLPCNAYLKMYFIDHPANAKVIRSSAAGSFPTQIETPGII